MDAMNLFHQWCQHLQKVAMFNLFFLSVFLLFSLLYLFDLLKAKKQNLPPSPPKLPLIGNLHQLGPRIHRILHVLSAKYGPVMLLHFGRVPVVIVSSAEVARDIMKNQDLAFSNRGRSMASEVLFSGSKDILCVDYGDYWRQVKKICVMELLSQKRVQSFHFVREEEVAKMVEKIRASCLNKAAIDLSDMLLTITNNIISRSAFGRIYEQEDDKSFGALTRRAMDLMGAFYFKDVLPFLGWMDRLTGVVPRLQSTSKALYDLFDKVIEEHKGLNSTNGENSDSKDMVDILLHVQNSGQLDMELTREHIKAILLDMFIGGTDTTAALLEWGMAELVRNPEVMKKAQEEVRRVVGQKAKPTEADIKEMVYLKYIVKETFRLHGPAINGRETYASAKLEGYNIPPKTRVIINSWAIQRDPKIWERPEEFIPERFANISIDFKGGDGQFLPFGFGRRACPGMAFGLAQAELVFANLLYWFDWEIPNGGIAEDLDMTEADGIFNSKKTPLLLVPIMHSP